MLWLSVAVTTSSLLDSSSRLSAASTVVKLAKPRPETVMSSPLMKSLLTSTTRVLPASS